MGRLSLAVLSFSNGTKKEDLTLEGVADYVFAPLRLHHDRAMSKERLKEIIRRWHRRDRFEVKYLPRHAVWLTCMRGRW